MTTTDKPTAKLHSYYRSVLVPMYASEGFESHQEAHRGLMAGFFEMHPDDPNLPSMADMPHETAVRYVDWVIRQLSEMGCRVPPPRKDERCTA